MLLKNNRERKHFSSRKYICFVAVKMAIFTIQS